MALNFYYNMEKTYNEMYIEHEQLKMINNYINFMFQFRTTINHRLTNYEIKNLIKQLNYNFNKTDEDCESYYTNGESEIFTNIDKNQVHLCMVRAGFIVKTETNNYIYNVSIKPKIQQLLKYNNY